MKVGLILEGPSVAPQDRDPYWPEPCSQPSCLIAGVITTGVALSAGFIQWTIDCASNSVTRLISCFSLNRSFPWSQPSSSVFVLAPMIWWIVWLQHWLACPFFSQAVCHMAWKCCLFLVDFLKMILPCLLLTNSSFLTLSLPLLCLAPKLAWWFPCSQILHHRTYGLGHFHYIYANLSAIETAK